MSPAGFYWYAYAWYLQSDKMVSGGYPVDNGYSVYPVINLNANVKATGTGTSKDPYVVQTN